MTARGVVVLLLLMSGCERSSDRPVYPRGPHPPPGPPPPGAPPPNAPPRSNDDIARVVNAAYPTFTSCYQNSESFMTRKSGTVTVFFDIAPQGNVIRASDQPPPGVAIQGSPLNDARLTACLVEHFYRLTFPAASDETAASWLFSFGS